MPPTVAGPISVTCDTSSHLTYDTRACLVRRRLRDELSRAALRHALGDDSDRAQLTRSQTSSRVMPASTCHTNTTHDFTQHHDTPHLLEVERLVDSGIHRPKRRKVNEHIRRLCACGDAYVVIVQPLTGCLLHATESFSYTGMTISCARRVRQCVRCTAGVKQGRHVPARQSRTFESDCPQTGTPAHTHLQSTRVTASRSPCTQPTVRRGRKCDRNRACPVRRDEHDTPVARTYLYRTRLHAVHDTLAVFVEQLVRLQRY
jgi:hypothetical protein